MDNHPHDLPPKGGRPPRNELQGPRPTPLKVRKDSYKIKKPPVAPPVHHQQPPPQQPPRQPVIIYTVSPKVIHADPSEFMTVVQRLTGPDPTTSTSSSSSSACSPSSFQFPSFSSVGYQGVGISPAARFASIEKTKIPREDMKMAGPSGVMDGEMVEISGGPGGGGIQEVERTGFFPAGILSPGPGSLPPISPNLFSPFFHYPSSSHTNLHHHHEIMSGVQHQTSTRNYTEVSNINQQNNPFSTNNFTSPSPTTTFSPSSLDLLRRILDN